MRTARWSSKTCSALSRARFRDHVGVPPKTVARILRFDHAANILLASRDVRWSQIAYECGYYDQAHFNREFRELAGGTPSDFLERAG